MKKKEDAEICKECEHFHAEPHANYKLDPPRWAILWCFSFSRELEYTDIEKSVCPLEEGERRVKSVPLKGITTINVSGKIS